MRNMWKTGSAAVSAAMLLGLFGGMAVQADSEILKDVESYEFTYTSGVGAWASELSIEADGFFKLSYHDSDMGDMGEDYPSGTTYMGTLRGMLGEPEKVNDYTYKLTIEQQELEREEGSEEIRDEIRYVYSKAYGLDADGDIYLYLPEAPRSELPEEFLKWADMALLDGSETLDMYGIYNVKDGAGFVSYVSESLPVDSQIAFLDGRDGEYKELLQGDMGQQEMNLYSAELYRLWDDALNSMWKDIKMRLPEEEYQPLLEEQMQWISDKEAAVEAARSEWEGGTLAPYAAGMKAAELTMERVHELAAYDRAERQ